MTIFIRCIFKGYAIFLSSIFTYTSFSTSHDDTILYKGFFVVLSIVHSSYSPFIYDELSLPLPSSSPTYELILLGIMTLEAIQHFVWL